jgi:disulfide bond formation protein DsbB
MLKNTFQTLAMLATNKNYWLALFTLGILMEATALLYQYVGGYEPCILCIHVRLWTLCFSLIALLAYFVRNIKYSFPVAHLLITLVMLSLLGTSWELLQTERGNVMGSCSYFLGMPEWFAVDQWLPAVFEVRASCAGSPELLFGITMAEGLTVFSAIMVVVSAALTISAFAGKR